MKSPTNRLIATIVGLILLPLVIYTVYELSSVTENEEVIEKIYKDQLDAIIFSVNQFSNDNISILMDKIENELSPNLTLDKTEPYVSFGNFKVLFFKVISDGYNSEIIIDEAFRGIRKWSDIGDSLRNADPNLIDQLVRYKEGGYRKIEPRGTMQIANQNLQVIHGVLMNNGKPVMFTGLLSIEGFANNVLAPKLQQIAEGELIITLGYRDSQEYVYLTDSLTKEVAFAKSMWLFPQLDVGISSNNKTVKELVDERTQNNLLATFILILLLVFGFGLVVRNLRREMMLAQTKSDFVSNVSHELRTPLSLISMFAETLFLDRVPSAEKRKEYEEIILKETNRLTNIVNKILSFSQIEANKRTYHPQTMDINQLTAELVHDYAYHLERNGFRFELNQQEHLDSVEVDRDALYEAMVNLVDNAMKYSPEEKFIQIRTGSRDQAVFIEVVDHGVGIASDKIKQIFDKFYRVSEGNVHSSRGAGLGLTLVSHIVDSHGGDIEVESTPGKGSIFRLVFYTEDNGKNPDS